MIDYAQILSHKYTGSEWTLNGNDYEGLTWISETNKPTKAELDKLWQTVKAEIEQEKISTVAAKAALLYRLGITAEEAALLLS